MGTRGTGPFPEEVPRPLASASLMTKTTTKRTTTTTVPARIMIMRTNPTLGPRRRQLVNEPQLHQSDNDPKSGQETMIQTMRMMMVMRRMKATTMTTTTMTMAMMVMTTRTTKMTMTMKMKRKRKRRRTTYPKRKERLNDQRSKQNRRARRHGQPRMETNLFVKRRTESSACS